MLIVRLAVRVRGPFQCLLLAFCLTFLLSFFSAPALAAESEAAAFKASDITLYQPNAEVEDRLSSPEGLAKYIKEVEAVCTKFFATSKVPESFHIVFAVRPDKLSKIWFVPAAGTKTPEGRDTLRVELEKLPPFPVKGGPVAFALNCTVAGGIPKQSGLVVPIPKEWNDAKVKKGRELRIPDEMLPEVWPTTP